MAAALLNLGRKRAKATLELGADAMGVDDLLEQRKHRLGKDGTLDVSVARYGYLWLRVRRDAARQLG